MEFGNVATLMYIVYLERAESRNLYQNPVCVCVCVCVRARGYSLALSGTPLSSVLSQSLWHTDTGPVPLSQVSVLQQRKQP